MSQTANAWLKWEWRIALLTIVGGLIIGGAVVAYLSFRPSPEAVEAARQQAAGVALLHAEQLVCAQAISTAKNFGIVPNYAVLAKPLPSTTNVTGRYTCVAGTNVSHYNMAVDLLCRELTKSKCVSLYSVSQDNGTVLYKRRS